MGNAFNRQALLDRFGGDLELLRQIADLFHGSAGPWLKEMHEAQAAGDLPRVQRLAHTLKGSVGNFLGHRAANAAFAVQQLAGAGQTSGLPEAIAALETEVALLETELNQMIGPASTRPS